MHLGRGIWKKAFGRRYLWGWARENVYFCLLGKLDKQKCWFLVAGEAGQDKMLIFDGLGAGRKKMLISDGWGRWARENVDFSWLGELGRIKC